jgi:hypothetical protein
MKSKKNWIILATALVLIIGAGIVVISGTLVAASELADLNYMAFVPLVLNQTPLQDEPIGELKTFTPIWELGASDADPSIGANGTIHGWYIEQAYSNGTKIDLELYIYVRGGYAGIGTGSYEIYLPDEVDHA